MNKYGKTFLDKLNKTRNPLLKTKYIKKIVKRKIIDSKSALRRAFYKWKNNVDVDKAVNIYVVIGSGYASYEVLLPFSIITFVSSWLKDNLILYTPDGIVILPLSKASFNVTAK